MFLKIRIRIVLPYKTYIYIYIILYTYFFVVVVLNINLMLETKIYIYLYYYYYYVDRLDERKFRFEILYMDVARMSRTYPTYIFIYLCRGAMMLRPIRFFEYFHQLAFRNNVPLLYLYIYKTVSVGRFNSCKIVSFGVR